MQLEFQPRKGSFLFQRISGVVTILMVLSVGVVFGSLLSEAVVLLGLIPLAWILLLVPTIASAFAAYGKEQYEIHPEHLVCRHGGLLSDGRTELDVRNITHVRLRLPWFRHKLFGIGDVRVESAGSAGSEITFESVLEPEKVYAQVQETMRARGYSLQGGTTLHEESPGVVGAVTDVVQLSMVIGGVIFVIVSSTAGAITEVLSSSMAQTIAAGGMLLIAGLGFVLGLGGLGIRYLDMRRRTYTVRDDMVVYTEGFLTRDNALIPFENLADVSTNRSFWDQLLGLYDVRVSCQGSGSEIVFRRLSNGEAMKSAITALVASAGSRKRALPSSAPEPSASASTQASTTASKPSSSHQLVAPDEAWTATLKMHTFRAMLSVTPALLIPPAWALLALIAAVRAARTEYHVGTDTLSQSYAFIGANQTQFAYDKVTGVQVTKTPLDDFFGTASVEVWSIGAPKPIQMRHIMRRDLNLRALLRQCGIPTPTTAAEVLAQSYGPKAAVISQAPSLIFLLIGAFGLTLGALLTSPLLLLALPLLVAFPLARFGWTTLRIRRQTFRLFPEHFEAETGIWFRKHVYVRYSDVKKIETVQIPWTRQGSLSLYVAGERILETQNGETRVPNVVQVAFLENMDRLADALDAFMMGRLEAAAIPSYTEPAHPALSVSKPSLRSEGVVLLIIGLFFPPLWLILPLVLWQARVRRFIVEADRVLRRDGIFFQRITSIPFHKLDSIQQEQGALGKAFGNGKVTLLTAGSSQPDLVLKHIPDYEAVYRLIRKRYQPSAT